MVKMFREVCQWLFEVVCCSFRNYVGAVNVQLGCDVEYSEEVMSVEQWIKFMKNFYVEIFVDLLGTGLMRSVEQLNIKDD